MNDSTNKDIQLKDDALSKLVLHKQYSLKKNALQKGKKNTCLSTYQTKKLANGSSSRFPFQYDNLPEDRYANCMSFHMIYGRTQCFPRRCQIHLKILRCLRTGRRVPKCRQLRKETPFRLPKPKQITRSSSSISLSGCVLAGTFPRARLFSSFAKFKVC